GAASSRPRSASRYTQGWPARITRASGLISVAVASRTRRTYSSVRPARRAIGGHGSRGRGAGAGARCWGDLGRRGGGPRVVRASPASFAMARTLRRSSADRAPEVTMSSNVVSLIHEGTILQTLADVAYMLSEGGRYPIVERDVVAMCDRLDP